MSRRAVVERLLERHGQTYADDAGIRLGRGTPSPLFRLLCLSLLLSARIRSAVAVDAARALSKHGWTTPQRMVAARWQDRARALNRAGYARYDERTSTMLGETSQLLLDRWGGDLRRLRADADRDLHRERALLKEFKGIGDVGANIFLREIQGVWSEVRPFVDRRALDVAHRLGIGATPEEVARSVAAANLPRLVAALVRAGLEGDVDQIRAQAAA